MKSNGKIVLIISKILDYMLAIVELSYIKGFIEKFDNQFSLGTVINGPALIRF